MTARCGLDALLSAGGPVRVAVRPCCLAALVGRRPGAIGDPSGSDAAVGSSSRRRDTGGTSSITPILDPGHVGLAPQHRQPELHDRGRDAGAAPVIAGAGLVCEAAEAELQVMS